MESQSTNEDHDFFNRHIFDWIVEEVDDEGLPNPYSAWNNDLESLRSLAELLDEPSQYSEKHTFSGNAWFAFGDSVLGWFKLDKREKSAISKFKKDYIVGGFTIEDVQDSTLERHGKPTALALYKETWTLLSGFCHSLGGVLLCHTVPQVAGATDRRPQTLPDIVWDAFVLTASGQVLEHTFIHGPPITMAHYKLVTTQKFAGLTTLPLMIASKYSGKTLPGAGAANAVCALVSYLFTVRNEYASLFSDSYKQAKSAPAEDISLGLFTYPILKALETDDRELFLAILKKQTQDAEMLQFAVHRLEQLGIKDDIRAECERVGRQIVSELAQSPPNPKLLKELLKLKSKSSEFGADY